MKKKQFCLNDIIRPEPSFFQGYVRTPVYRKKDYIDGLRKNYIECGLDPKKVDEIDRKIPEETHRTYDIQKNKLVIDEWETVKVNIEYNEDKIKLSIDTSLWDMFDSYYTKGINPPIELKVKAYRSMDFSEDYIKDMIQKDEINKTFSTKVSKMIEKIFDKEPVKKAPKPKKKPVVVDEDEEVIVDEDEENEDDDEGTEEDALVDEDAENDDDYVEDEEVVDVDDDVE